MKPCFDCCWKVCCFGCWTGDCCGFWIVGKEVLKLTASGFWVNWSPLTASVVFETGLYWLNIKVIHFFFWKTKKIK